MTTNVTLTPMPPASTMVLTGKVFNRPWSGWLRNLYNFLRSPTFTNPPIVPKYTVSTLPQGTEGMLAMVTDATLTAITGLGLAPVGGGGNTVLVYYDNAGWKIL